MFRWVFWKFGSEFSVHLAKRAVDLLITRSPFSQGQRDSVTAVSLDGTTAAGSCSVLLGAGRDLCHWPILPQTGNGMVCIGVRHARSGITAETAIDPSLSGPLSHMTETWLAKTKHIWPSSPCRRLFTQIWRLRWHVAAAKTRKPDPETSVARRETLGCQQPTSHGRKRSKYLIT